MNGIAAPHVPRFEMEVLSQMNYSDGVTSREAGILQTKRSAFSFAIGDSKPTVKKTLRGSVDETFPINVNPRFEMEVFA